MTTSEVTESDQREETWKPIPGFSKYEAGDLGHVRGQVSGKVLAARVGTHGYLEVKPYDDDGKRQTRTVHSLVLLTFAGPRAAGMETLHGKGGPLDNRWPENLRYGTKAENAADQAEAGTAKTPANYPCINHERCGGMVANAGSRCLPCAIEVGKEATAMLRAGLAMDEVTRRLGYKSRPWVEKLARNYGGFTGPLPQARPRPAPTRQPWLQRVTATLRYRLGRSNGK